MKSFAPKSIVTSSAAPGRSSLLQFGSSLLQFRGLFQLKFSPPPIQVTAARSARVSSSSPASRVLPDRRPRRGLRFEASGTRIRDVTYGSQEVSFIASPVVPRRLERNEAREIRASGALPSSVRNRREGGPGENPNFPDLSSNRGNKGSDWGCPWKGTVDQRVPGFASVKTLTLPTSFGWELPFSPEALLPSGLSRSGQSPTENQNLSDADFETRLPRTQGRDCRIPLRLGPCRPTAGRSPV